MKHRTPSETALRIAGNQIASSLDPVLRTVMAFPDEPYSERFVRAHSFGARLRLGMWKWATTRNFIFQLSDARYPGASLHLLLRKRYIAETVRAALAPSPNRAEQMVIFGGGFDPLALMLHPEFPETPIVEIDHPETQAIKRRALTQQGKLPNALTLLPIDFAQESVEEKLRSVQGFRPQANSLFLAEGLLMYLSEAEVLALFEVVRRNSAPGGRFLFTFLDSAILEDPDSYVSLMARDLERMGEPLQWHLHRKKLDSFLREHGFKRLVVADHQTLRSKYLQPLRLDRPLGQGELIAVAQVS